jgi:choice-of-anchor C domain-containing protein
MVNKRILIGVLLSVLFVSVPMVYANTTIKNGSFEIGPTVNGDFTEVGNGSTAIQDWTVLGGIDYIKTYYKASIGSYSLDLDASPSWGGVQQTLSTTPNQQYKVTFALSGNFVYNYQKLLQVSAGNTTNIYTVSMPLDWSRDNMGWVDKTFIFTASSSSTDLKFLSIKNGQSDNGYCGPALDNVRISSVPLPPTVLLFGTGLIGMGLVGFRKRMS